MSDKETICTMALARVKSLSLSNAQLLYRSMGTAEAVFEHKDHIRDCVPDATDRLVAALKNTDEAVRRAEAEMEFVQRNNIRCLCMNDSEYPQRLKECGDAPLCLFYCGTADLNAVRTISIVGTRRCTEYGKDLCRNFIADLKRCQSDILVVSGLAYGVDIHAHRAAIENGMDTVGVLAHGLDMIYPSAHRQTAAQMVRQGGLLTEYMSSTVPDKGNFVRRNRIVAGICDATVVVESAAHGGGLITAELAESYHRDVFAFPGRVYDEYSEGCNRLIKDNRAVLIQSAEDFVSAMRWDNPQSAKKEPRQQELFIELTAEEQLIVDALRRVDDKPINQIVVESGIPYSRVSVLMFELEMKGVVIPIGGARYRLLRR
ncbi:MAG: DNA-processing protein DprA [Bacteroides sp.]|nr:DNA-processing protein DprA [Roseburia sp.]MCM1346453.1 DNA-processing protein DprA [Bacteroides sp.]MCM1421036.1 DNA-processing protein DprA [Bacteroides sp.]